VVAVGDISRKELRLPLNGIASALDDHLREYFGRRIGFALLVFELSPDGVKVPVETNVAYIANAEREGCIDVLRTLLGMLEVGMDTAPPGPTGRA
jgi:hypothetical protein